MDESMLTGESMPVEKIRGANICAGTVNQSGQLIARVTSTGEETALAHIIAAVARAQTSRANIQRLGDRVSSVFVPIVVLIALATAAWWGLMPDEAHRVSLWLGHYLWSAHPPASGLAAAAVAAAAVLIVACPCAMGLATPAAIMAGSNAAARRGILIRDGVALEKAGAVTAVVGLLAVVTTAALWMWFFIRGPAPADAATLQAQGALIAWDEREAEDVVRRHNAKTAGRR